MHRRGIRQNLADGRDPNSGPRDSARRHRAGGEPRLRASHPRIPRGTQKRIMPSPP